MRLFYSDCRRRIDDRIIGPMLDSVWTHNEGQSMHSTELLNISDQILKSICVLVAVAWLQHPGTAFAEDRVQFNRDIRPIVADTCFLCHGPDKNSREAGLRLDIREE